MANEYWVLSKDYRMDKGRVLNPIAVMGHSRKFFPYDESLQPWTKQTRVYNSVFDLNFEYKMRPESSRSEFGIFYDDIDTPAIATQIGYDYDDFKTINNGLMPWDKRQAEVSKYIRFAEDIIGLSAWTAVLGKAVTGMSSTGTNSTVATAELDVASAATIYSTFEGIVGQFIDNFDEIGQLPFVACCTPDVAKALRGLQATSLAKETCWDELDRRLKAIHPASYIFQSKYLGCTPAENAKKKTITVGSTNFVLGLYSPEYYRVEHSKIEPRTDGLSQRTGMDIQFVERFRPVYREKKALVYSGTVANV